VRNGGEGAVFGRRAVRRKRQRTVAVQNKTVLRLGNPAVPGVFLRGAEKSRRRDAHGSGRDGRAPQRRLIGRDLFTSCSPARKQVPKCSHSGTKVASSGGVKVFSSAEQPVAGKGRRVVPSAKPIVICTVPFSFRWFLLRFLAVCGAGGLVYWVGAGCFERWKAEGTMEVAALDIWVLVFAFVALCWGVTRCWKYFDPYPEMRISPGAAPLGASFDVEWSFHRAKRRLQKIGMVLEGREEVMAEDKTGKKARPQKLTAAFYVEELEMPKRSDQGHVHVQLPEGLMPSMEAEKTRIVWLLRFESQIKWGPRMKYDFPVRVLPEVGDG
jgi:hypothetical protein